MSATAAALEQQPPEWVVVFCLIAVTVQLIRLSMDLIQTVSLSQAATSDKTKAATTTEALMDASSLMSTTPSTSTSATTPYTTVLNALKNGVTTPSYGSIVVDGDDEEEQPLLSQSQGGAISAGTVGPNNNDNNTTTWRISIKQGNLVFFTAWTMLSLLFLVTWIMKAVTIFPAALLLSTSATLVFEDYMLACDWQRQRYGVVQRFFHISASLTLWCVYAILWLPTDTKNRHNSSATLLDGVLVAAATANVVLTVAEGWVTAHYVAPVDKSTSKKRQLSWSAIYILVKPYVWPDATDSSAVANRLRAIGTWFCVIASKVCGLVSPLYLGWASTALAHQDYAACIRYSIWYSVVSWLGTTFREGQSLIYLKVAQAAFVQLSETAFGHLHSLSLDWHLRKKLGEVLRSMDRGIDACDTLMKYLCLWLVPALAECVVVCIIFATYFKYLPLGVTVFYFVFAYIVWTIVLTVWRKKFRKALVQHDNEWHDLFTDSLINFETVKYFTAEQYEKDRFADAVSKYQAGSVHVQGSLSFLNISQQIMLKTCLALSLSLAAIGIQKRIDCCVNIVGCDSGISDCCQSVSQQVCPGSKYCAYSQERPSVRWFSSC
jgi:ABC transporter transmembrane region